MKSPYEILKVKQSSTKKEIQAAFFNAIKTNSQTKEFTNKEITEALQQLTVPEKRLIADFLFPISKRGKRPKLIDSESILGENERVDLIVNQNSFDSINIKVEYD
ncbi:MAG: hypothetical protein K8I03_00330 [Ignavibacteria bacterium]|nr:hypothetical protein [Ignavibacteria bacterium]